MLHIFFHLNFLIYLKIYCNNVDCVRRLEEYSKFYFKGKYSSKTDIMRLNETESENREVRVCSMCMTGWI